MNDERGPEPAARPGRALNLADSGARCDAKASGA
jgi:hypothetical protein